MHSARRVTLLRLVAITATGVSAALVADSMNPGRTFCPVEAACEKAKSSALGSVGGIPTSVLGMMAFGGFFLVTLLPVEWSRRVVRLGGVCAAIMGAALFAYQAYVLKSFCPLCLLADGAGLVAGMIAITWPDLPRRRSGKRLAGESSRSRVRWLLFAAVMTVLPFVWPRPQPKGWEEIPDQPSFEEEDAVPPTAARPGGQPTPVPPVAYTAPPSPSRPPIEPRPPEVVTPRPGQLPPAPVPGRPPTPPAPESAEPPPRPPIQVVEYVNAYCQHCRATHRRLEQVIAELGLPVRRYRVYTWASNDFPMWARAVAYASTLGLEDAMFEALIDSRSQDPQEVFAAAQRAGVDPQGLQAALRDPNPPPRLVRDRRLAQGAHLRGLPTLDIGRRRLMGEQSEAELRDSLLAATR